MLVNLTTADIPPEYLYMVTATCQVQLENKCATRAEACSRPFLADKPWCSLEADRGYCPDQPN